VNVIRESRARSTGATVLLIDNRDFSFEDDPSLGREAYWATVCDTHGNYVLHKTRRLAESFMSVPEEFCETCQDEAKA
jgi:hypothetical protein